MFCIWSILVLCLNFWYKLNHCIVKKKKYKVFFQFINSVKFKRFYLKIYSFSNYNFLDLQKCRFCFTHGLWLSNILALPSIYWFECSFEQKKTRNWILCYFEYWVVSVLLAKKGYGQRKISNWHSNLWEILEVSLIQLFIFDKQFLKM